MPSSVNRAGLAAQAQNQEVDSDMNPNINLNINSRPDAETTVVAALYKFVDFPDFKAFKSPLYTFCVDQGIKGTLLLAAEGINGTVAGSRAAIDALLNYLRKTPALEGRFCDIEHKESFASTNPFYRTKIKLKKEIVTLGVPEASPAFCVGTYVDPCDWNQVIEDPDVIVIDTRNDYEYAIGSFKGAINPDTRSFRQFPAFVEKACDPSKHKKVAMFCTGGIRCEKASSLMLQQGFETVYHLKGGILKYLEEVPEEQSLWQGECFVFDNRVAVTHGLKEGRYDLCHGCRHPIDADDKQSPHYQEGVCCPHCHDTLTDEQRARFTERQKQIELAKRRNEVPHLGYNPRQVKRGEQQG